MDSLTFKVVVAGIMFGLWPLFMNKSGLNGNVSSLVFSVVILVCVLPFAIHHISGAKQDFTGVVWSMAILAGATSAVGLLFFNDALAKSTPLTVGALFVIMIVVQAMVPAIYSIVMNGGITATKALGFVLAIAGATLLTKA